MSLAAMQSTERHYLKVGITVPPKANHQITSKSQLSDKEGPPQRSVDDEKMQITVKCADAGI